MLRWRTFSPEILFFSPRAAGEVHGAACRQSMSARCLYHVFCRCLVLLSLQIAQHSNQPAPRLQEDKTSA